MENLKEATLEELSAFGYSLYDVAWVGLGEMVWRDGIGETREIKAFMTFSAFSKAADYEYDDGYGGVNVRESLVVVFKDGSWLERHSYDGAEWWEYKSTPSRPDNDISDMPWPELRAKIFPGDFGDDDE